MSPETNVEYRTSPNFPVLHTKYHDFLPGQVPGKSMVIYEPTKPVLCGVGRESILVRNDSFEFSVLLPSSESSQGRFLSDPKFGIGYCLDVGQKGEEVTVSQMSWVGGFGKPLWIVKGDRIVNTQGYCMTSSETGVAVIPVISGNRDGSCLILCDQTDLTKPAIQKFIEEVLGGETVLPLDKFHLDIPALPEAK